MLVFFWFPYVKQEGIVCHDKLIYTTGCGGSRWLRLPANIQRAKASVKYLKDWKIIDVIWPGRQKKTWLECVNNELLTYALKSETRKRLFNNITIANMELQSFHDIRM